MNSPFKVGDIIRFKQRYQGIVHPDNKDALLKVMKVTADMRASGGYRLEARALGGEWIREQNGHRCKTIRGWAVEWFDKIENTQLLLFKESR